MPSWERLQEGPEEPLTTDDLDADILLSENRSNRHYGFVQIFRNFFTTRNRYCVPILILATFIILLIPTILVILIQRGSSASTAAFRQNPLAMMESPASTTPFIEPFDFDNSSETSIRSFSPPEFSPILDFLYDYFSLYESTSSNTTNSANDSAGVIETTVYYEALNIPSRVFLSHQFFPQVFKDGSLNTNFFPKLVPYGHANMITDAVTGADKIVCENGYDECQGNLVHACAIRHTQWNNTESVTKLMHYIHCMIKDIGILNRAADDVGKKCAEGSGTNWNVILNCTQSYDGMLVVKTFKQKTDTLLLRNKSQAPIPLPVVTVNGYGILSEEEKSDFSNFITKRLETSSS